jgi:hypothetical protein
MRFEFYQEGLSGAPLLSVDGTVEGALHLSHWEGNRTPEELRADTSTEIALNFAAWPGRGEWARGVEVVVRPRVARRNLSALVGRLNVSERGRGVWKADRSELTSAVKFFDAAGAPAASRLEPDEVAAELREALKGQAAT